MTTAMKSTPNQAPSRKASRKSIGKTANESPALAAPASAPVEKTKVAKSAAVAAVAATATAKAKKTAAAASPAPPVSKTPAVKKSEQPAAADVSDSSSKPKEKKKSKKHQKQEEQPQTQSNGKSKTSTTSTTSTVQQTVLPSVSPAVSNASSASSTVSAPAATSAATSKKALDILSRLVPNSSFQLASSSSSAAASASATVTAATKKQSKKSDTSAESTKKSIPSYRSLGGLVNHSASTLSKNGKLFFIAKGAFIEVYNADSTGSLVQVLGRNPADRHSSDVTSVAINPINELQLISSSMDGTVRTWDYMSSSLLKTYKAERPVVSMSLTRDSKTGHVSAFLLQVSKQSGTYDLTCIMNLTSHGRAKRLHIDNIATQQPVFALSSDSTQLAAITSRGLSVYDITGQRSKKSPASSVSVTTGGFVVRKYNTSDPLTTVAFNPVDGSVATGVSDGRIIVWHIDSDSSSTKSEQPLARSTLHWHAHSVNTICYMKDGTHLMSGGREGVLVMWQLDTNQKQFVPRMGAPIVNISISQDQSHVAVGFTDNTVRVLSSTNLTLRAAIQLVKPVEAVSTSQHQQQSKTSAASSSPLTRIVRDPATGCAVFRGPHATLQFYDIDSDEALYDVEIARFTRVSPTNEGDSVPEPVISQFAFSSCGRWMATVDTTIGQNHQQSQFDATLATFPITPMITLKMWSRDPINHRFTLNTRADRPHGIDSVLALEFLGSSDNGTLRLASLGAASGDLRIWRLRNPDVANTAGEDADEVVPTWSCASVCKFRSDTSASAMAVSPDGSLLAVAYGPIIALWDPSTASVKATLASSSVKARITDLFFVAPSATASSSSSTPAAVYGPPALIAHKVDVPEYQYDHDSATGVYEGKSGSSPSPSSASVVESWNLASLSLMWSSKYSGVRALIRSPHSPVFAICRSTSAAANGESRLQLLFHTTSRATAVASEATFSIPSANVQGVLLDDSNTNKISGASAAPWTGFELAVLTKRCEWKLFEIVPTGKSQRPKDARQAKRGKLQESAATGMFTEIFGANSIRTFDEDEADEEATGERLPLAPLVSSAGADARQKIMDMPAHLLPPVSALFEQYMGTMMPASVSSAIAATNGQQQRESGESESEVEPDSDDDSDDDNAMDIDTADSTEIASAAVPSAQEYDVLVSSLATKLFV